MQPSDIIRRIQDLNLAASRIADGDLSSRAHVEGEDDITALAASFNKMAELVQERTDEIIKHEIDLREKNDQLYRAMAEIQQNSVLWEWLSNENEKQNKKLAETVSALERSNRQLAETQMRLLQSEKMASAGRLAAGVAHEMNNPLGFVKGNISSVEAYLKDFLKLDKMYKELDLCLRNTRLDEKTNALREAIEGFRDEADIEFVLNDLQKLIDESYSGLDRALSIVGSLKSFTHISENEICGIDINMELEATLGVLSDKLNGINVRKEYGALPDIDGDPRYLGQAFASILENAVHAINDAERTGNIIVSTRHEGEEIVVEITDNGCGIPEENVAKVFEPFFTTRPVGSGKGLGLSLAYQAIEKHKGNIKIQSRIGEGTSIIIELPVTKPG